MPKTFPPAMTFEQCTAVNLLHFSEMIELGMRMVRAAAARVVPLIDDQDGTVPEAAAPEPGSKPGSKPAPARSSDPYLQFARATRVVRDAITAQARAFAALAAPAAAQSASRPAAPPAPTDPDKILLRQALHDTTRGETDRAARARLCRSIDECLEAEHRANPDAELDEILVAVANQLSLPLDVKRLPDRLLGLPHRPGHPQPPPFRRK